MKKILLKIKDKKIPIYIGKNTIKSIKLDKHIKNKDVVIITNTIGYRVNYIGLDRYRRVCYMSIHGNAIGCIDDDQNILINKKASAMHIGKSGYTYIAEIITNETRISRIDITCDEHEILGELLDVDVIVLLRGLKYVIVLQSLYSMDASRLMIIKSIFFNRLNTEGDFIRHHTVPS